MFAPLPTRILRTGHKLACGWLGALFLGTTLFAQGGRDATDPLKALVQTLSSNQPAPAEQWIPVLVAQPKSTTTDLWLLLQEERQRQEQRAYEAILLEISHSLAETHSREAFSSQDWRPRVRIALEILEAIGGADQLQEVLELLDIGSEGALDVPPGYQLSFETQAFQDALLAALERDRDGWEVLYQAYGPADFQVARAMLRALGDADFPRTANALGRWIGHRPQLDAILLTQIARVLRNPEIRIAEAHLAQVRRLVPQGHASVRQSAIRVLGFADDVISIQPLIQVLNDPNLALHEESLRALHRITAMTLDGHPDRWRFWFDEETRWWREQAPRTLGAIQASHPTHIAEILRELGSKRLFRRELTPYILPLTKDVRPEVVRMSLATLDALRPPLALVLEPLSALLDHRHPQVRADAQRVLSYLGADVEQLLAQRNTNSPPAPYPQPK